MYYALIGLSNPKSSIRVYSLSILNTIGKHNAESIVDVTEKVLMMSRDPHWEVKTQCLIFAATILSNFREMAHLLVVKADDMKGGIQKTMSGKPGSAQGGDRNAIKKNLQMNIDIIANCFNPFQSQDLLKIGLYEL